MAVLRTLGTFGGNVRPGHEISLDYRILRRMRIPEKAAGVMKRQRLPSPPKRTKSLTINTAKG
jgi:hypothetical protein